MIQCIIPVNQAFGFDDLMLKLLQTNEHVAVLPYYGHWLDIGRPDDYGKVFDYWEKVNLK